MEEEKFIHKDYFFEEEKTPNQEMPPAKETAPPPASPPPSSYSQTFPASEPKPKGNLMKIIIGVIVIGVLGTGTALATRIWDPLWNPFRPDPEKVINEMTKKMEGIKTFHSQMDFGINIKNESAADIAMKSETDSDTNDPNNLKSTGNIAMAFTMEGMQFSLGLETKTIGKDSYVKFTTIPALPMLTPYLQMMGIEPDQFKNQWIKIDQTALLESMGVSSEELNKLQESEELNKLQEEQQKKQEEIVTKLKNLFENKKFYLVDKELPDEEINGINVYHYAVSLDKNEIKSIIPEVFKIIGESLGGTDTDANVLSSLSEAQLKAKEAGVKADMGMIRTTAEIIYDNNHNSYSGLSCDYSDVSALCGDIVKYAGTKPVIFTSKQKYCAFTPLPIKGYYYCIDSGFKAVTTNIDPQGTGYCNGQTFVCPKAVEISQEDYKKVADEEFSKGLDKFFEKVGELSGELWIGKKDNLLYRFKGEKIFDLSQFAEGGKGTISIKLDINLSKFNQPVNIEAPSQYKGLDEILGSLMGQYGKSLGVAQTRAKDAKIMSDISQIRAGAEMLYSDKDSYKSLCSNFTLNENAPNYGTQLAQLKNDIVEAQGGLSDIVCYSSAESYCLEVDLASTDRGRWCVDSFLASKEISDNYTCAGSGTSNAPYQCPTEPGTFPLKEEPGLLQASIFESILKMFRK